MTSQQDTEPRRVIATLNYERSRINRTELRQEEKDRLFLELEDHAVEALTSWKDKEVEAAKNQGHWVVRSGGLGNLSYGACSCGYKTKGYEAEESLRSHIDWFKSLQSQGGTEQWDYECEVCKAEFKGKPYLNFKLCPEHKGEFTNFLNKDLKPESQGGKSETD